jgi:hypothetical protein
MSVRMLTRALVARGLVSDPSIMAICDPEPAPPGSQGGSWAFGGWVDPQLAPLLLGIILLAVLGTAILFAASVLVFARRRETRHLLVMVIVGALLTRSVVGLGTVFGLTPMFVHHLLEHSLDFLVAVGILLAVQRARAGPVGDS